jgi:hypothetical protein
LAAKKRGLIPRRYLGLILAPDHSRRIFRAMPVLSPAKSRNSLRSAHRPSEGYCRTDILPGLLGLWPREVEDYSAEGTLALILKLKRALRAERKRGQARSFTYSLNRHMRLVSALKHEISFLKSLRAPRKSETIAGIQLYADLGSGKSISPSRAARLTGTAAS